MPVQAISPGPVWPIVGGVVYALPGSPCQIIIGAPAERSNLYEGAFYSWSGGYNHVGGFVRPLSSTTIQAIKVKMDGSAYPPGSYVPIRDDSGAYNAVVMKDNPSYYWNLNETSGTIAADTRGGAHGTISGGVTLNQSGAVGKGMLFDGIDDRIAITQVSLLPTFSFEAWFRTTAMGDLTFISTANGTDDKIIIQLKAGRIQFYVEFKSGGFDNIEDIVGPVYNDNQWHHLVITCSGVNAIPYIDGVLDPLPVSLPKPLFGVSAKPLDIGFDVIYGGRFNGTIDEVAIYPYALSAAQISKHYLAKSVPPNSYASLIMGDNPSNYWQLDEEGGLVATDIKGGKNGTISGGVTLNQAGIGKSYLFNTGKITVPNGPYLNIGYGSYTMECWWKTSNPGAGGFWVIDGKHNGTANPGMSIRQDSQALGFVHDGTTSTIARGTKVINDGQWHYIVVVLLRGGTDRIIIYVDGVEDANQVVPTAGKNLTPPPEVNFCIGAPFHEAGEFVGNIDEVAIYPRALTAQEILSHYQARGL